MAEPNDQGAAEEEDLNNAVEAALLFPKLRLVELHVQSKYWLKVRDYLSSPARACAAHSLAAAYEKAIRDRLQRFREHELLLAQDRIPLTQADLFGNDAVAGAVGAADRRAQAAYRNEVRQGQGGARVLATAERLGLIDPERSQ